MTDALVEFFQTASNRHVIFLATILIAVLGIGYVCFFFFSKEGRDERGKKIFANASFFTFLLTLIWLVLLSGPLFPLKVSSIHATAFMTNVSIDLLVGVQSLSIIVLKRIM